MRLVRRMAALAAALCFGAVAGADVVTLQQGLDGYSGVGDVYLPLSPTNAQAYNYGGVTKGYTYGTGDNEIILIQFDLAGIDATSVASAKLYLYNCDERYGGPTRAKQIGMSWDAGTEVNYNSIVDSAGHRHRHQPIATDFDLEAGQAWELQGGGSYKLDLSKPLATDPLSASRMYIRRGRTTEGGRIRGYDWTRTYGTRYGTLAELDGAAAPAAGTGFLYYYDEVNYDLYVRVDGDANAPTRLNFVYEDDSWTAASRLAAGYWEGDFTLENGDPVPPRYTAPTEDVWHVLDATDMVRMWLGADGQAQVDNFGLQIDAINSSSNGRNYFMSEVSGMYDPVNGVFEGDPAYDVNNAVDSATLRPMLVIDYTPVPEPATMALLGSGVVGLAAFRRRK